MIKTFYKKKPEKKIFFSRDMKIRSYAYGSDINKEFVDWRQLFLAKWNSPKTNFWILECGSIDGNAAKIDRVSELRVAEPGPTHGCIVKKQGALSPLWFDGYLFEVSKDGELIINGNISDITLGSEIKAWGVSASFNSKYDLYTLFVFGKNELGAGELRAYALDIDAFKGVSPRHKCSLPFALTLNKKSHLYCFGAHIFLLNESKLSYYYYNADLQRLEEVAICTDEPNADKEFLTGVAGAPVTDSLGFIYWRCSSSKIYYFKIGYPKQLGCIDMGESNEIIGIQTFRKSLFVYQRSKITGEYACYRCDANSYVRDGAQLFNKNTRYNLIYAEKNGILHYLKVPPLSDKGYSAKMNGSNEIVLSEINISRAEQMFCVNGDLYLNCSYIGATKKV